MVEPQPLKFSLRDQFPDQTMRRIEGACIFHPQPRERIDVEEAAVIDVARSKPLMAKLVMLAFKQMVQRKRLCGAIRSGPISSEATRDQLCPSVDIPDFCLEGRRFLAIGMTQASIARSEFKDVLAGGTVLRTGFPHDGMQDLAVAIGSDRQAMFEIPGRKAAFIRIVAQLDFALFQRPPIRRADDRQQHPATGAIWQLLPVDVEPNQR